MPKSQLGAYCHTHPAQLHPHFLLIFAGYKYQLYGNESKLSILSTAMLSHSHSLLSDIFSFVPILAFVLPSLDSFKITLRHSPAQIQHTLSPFSPTISIKLSLFPNHLPITNHNRHHPDQTLVVPPIDQEPFTNHFLWWFARHHDQPPGFQRIIP